MSKQMCPLSVVAVFLVSMLLLAFPGKARSQVSDQPDTPFKLATFEATGAIRIGILVQADQEKLMDLHEANAYVTRQVGLSIVSIPKEMRALIEQVTHGVSNRMYMIQTTWDGGTDCRVRDLPFIFSPDDVSIKAPIKYPPTTCLRRPANYRPIGTRWRHSAIGQARDSPPVEWDVDAERPYFVAKSPPSTSSSGRTVLRSPRGRQHRLGGAELAIIKYRPATLPWRNAHDYVFGYSIVFDVSRRGGSGLKPINRMFPGPNWFNGKSSDRAAPFGPYIVPKEFIQHDDLEIRTWVNGVIKQDSNTSYMIYDEAHMIRYLTSVQALYPGDVIATGTPDGVGRARNPPEYLKPGGRGGNGDRGHWKACYPHVSQTLSRVIEG